MLQVITYNKIIHAENISYMLIFRCRVQWSTNITTVVSEKKEALGRNSIQMFDLLSNHLFLVLTVSRTPCKIFIYCEILLILFSCSENVVERQRKRNPNVITHTTYLCMPDKHVVALFFMKKKELH